MLHTIHHIKHRPTQIGHFLSIILLCIVSFQFIACAGEPSQKNGIDTNKPVSRNSNGPTEAFDLDLNINGITPGYAFLTCMFGDQYYTLDSFAVEENGHIYLKQNNALAGGMYFIVLPDRQTNLQLLVTDEQKFSMTSDMRDILGQMKVVGNEETRLLYANLLYEQLYQEEYNRIKIKLSRAATGSAEAVQIEKERLAKIEERQAKIATYSTDYPDAFFTKFKLAGQNPVITNPKLPNGELDAELQIARYRQAYWDNVDFTDARLLRTPVFNNKLTSFFDKIVPPQIDSLIKYADFVTRQSMKNDSLFKFTANYLGVKYHEPTFMGSDAVYVYMVENFFTPELAFWAAPHEITRLQQDARIRHSSMLGEKAKDLIVYDTDGKEFSMFESCDADILVIYIYSPQCENCLKETPLVKEFYDKWKDKGVDVFALCIDPDRDVWNYYIQKLNLDWVNGYDPFIKSDYTFKYHIDTTPEIYVLNKDRVIVAKDLHAFQLEEILRRNMK